MARIKNTRALNKAVWIVGEGATEWYYFSHLKAINGYHCKLPAAVFSNSGLTKLAQAIDKVQSDAAKVICVFDADIKRKTAQDALNFDKFVNKYKDTNVILCDSMQSIEYWFLLHYKDTNRDFNNSAAVEAELTNYIDGYTKQKRFLEKDNWVKEMLKDDKLEKACSRAESYLSSTDGDFSYSKIYLAINELKKNFQ